MADNEWTPPSDAVISEETWTPPSDAAEVKKKYIRIEIGFWYIKINNRTITFRSPVTFS